MFGSVSCGVTAPFSCILVHTRFCLCPPSVCFPSPVEFLQSNPTGLQSRIPGDSQPFCWIPRLGNLLWALKLLQQCENFFGITVLQFVGRLFDGSIVELMATSSKRTYATYHASQVCCRQSPCPHRRPLLTCASTEHSNARRQVWLSLLWGSLLLSLGPGAHKVVCALQPSLAGLRFDSKCDFAPSTILSGPLLCPWMWAFFFFFWWDTTFSCQWLFSS